MQPLLRAHGAEQPCIPSSSCSLGFVAKKKHKPVCDPAAKARIESWILAPIPTQRRVGKSRNKRKNGTKNAACSPIYPCFSLHHTHEYEYNEAINGRTKPRGQKNGKKKYEKEEEKLGHKVAR